MGLDQYAYKVDKRAVDKPVDFDPSVSDADEIFVSEEISYWRKHADLQGWMHKLYNEKGGKDGDFNCSNLELTSEDIDKLEADVNSNSLPPTQGCFFGESIDEDKEDDLKFISKAREAFANGEAVYYSSWW